MQPTSQTCWDTRVGSITGVSQLIGASSMEGVSWKASGWGLETGRRGRPYAILCMEPSKQVLADHINSTNVTICGMVDKLMLKFEAD